MGSQTIESGVHGSAIVETIVLDRDLLAALEALPDSQGTRYSIWTAEQDEILRRYWGRKRQEDLARIIGYSVRSCKRRYYKLTEEI